MILDLNGAMNRLGNDVSLFREFIGFYREDYPRLLDALGSAIERADADAVHQHAHALKGLLASLGATDVMTTAGGIEKMGRGHDLADAKKNLQKLQGEIQKLNSELDAFCQSTREDGAAGLQPNSRTAQKNRVAGR